MGTKGSYSGGGGAVGDGLRDGIDDWLASLPGGDGPTGDIAPTDAASPPSSGGAGLSPAAARVLPTIALFTATRGGRSQDRSRQDSPVPPTRSAATSARVAGRGAAAAYAYRTGDAETLRDLGLDYEALRANPNVFDVAHRITQKICEDLDPGTIETDELLRVVGTLVERLLPDDPSTAPPPPDVIARQALALIIAETYFAETASELNKKDLTGPERASFEDDVEQACEELAARANLSPDRPTAAEFTTAIERGIDYLRALFESPAGE